MREHLIIALLFFSLPMSGFVHSSDNSLTKAVITHGPILGRLSHDGIGVWVRTSYPVRFRVRCTSGSSSGENSAWGETSLEHDNTGWVNITGLKPNSPYTYEIDIPSSGFHTQGGTFMTLPHEDMFRDAEHNPQGLYNFSFEFGCGNDQRVFTEKGVPAYNTMLEHLNGKIHFQIMNGDWLYEELRETPLQKWLTDNNVSADNVPGVVQVAPTIIGVWENYKLYLSRSSNLAKWHRYIPAFFTFDDHEILNDVYGTGSPGNYNRRAVFRDIGVQAWYDYLGWSNPPLYQNPQEIWFGKAQVKAGSDTLVDVLSDFSALDFEKVSTLHIHWGPNAGQMAPIAGKEDTTGGLPAAGVYEIKRILDRHRLLIHPAPGGDGDNVSYSIGRINYYQFRVSNCDFFVLDTRGNRELHDVTNPWKKDVSMLGKRQKAWLMDGMRKSDADFLFLVSSVNFAIPHGYYGSTVKNRPNKDEAWTVFLDEREQLITLWEKLDKPVFVLTGDLHNSIVVKVNDNIWEFASGPHNSMNHTLRIEGNRPPSGYFEWAGRKINIRWSSFSLNDVSGESLWHPYYCVVQVNNVINNPQKPGEERWVAFPQPQVVFQYYDGLTGELKYAEAIAAHGK